MNLGAAELVIIATLLVPIAFVVIAITGNLPKAEKFASINGLDDGPESLDQIRTVLRRTRRSRVAGGLVAMVLGGIAGSLTSAGFAIGGAGFGLLVGTLVGIAVAQLHPPAISDPVRAASLTVRDPADYRPRHATMITLTLAAAVVAYGIVSIVTAPGALGLTVGMFAVAFATVLAVPIGRLAQRRTIELRRSDVDPESVLVDDALRACAVRGIHHAVVGVLLCGLLLLGYAAVSTQNLFGITRGDAVLVQAPPLTRVIATGGGLRPDGSQYTTATWKEPNGERHHVRVRGTAPEVQVGSLWADGPWLAIGYWVTFLGFLGAIIEWSQAAKAWRRPQRVPMEAAA